MQQQPISNLQLDQVKGLIRDHLEKNRFFDVLKQAVAKDPRLALIDKNTLIEKIKKEGILNDIIQNVIGSKRKFQRVKSITRRSHCSNIDRENYSYKG